MHFAASQDNCEVMDYVLKELNFEINCQNSNGWSPLHCAAKKQNQKVFCYLRKMGADLALKDRFGRTALDYFTEISIGMNGFRSVF